MGAAGEAHTRGLALTLGRCYALALLLRHGAWALLAERDRRPLAAARRFAALGVDRILDDETLDSRLLASDEPAIPMSGIADILRTHLGAAAAKVPVRRLPDLVVRAGALSSRHMSFR